MVRQDGLADKAEGIRAERQKANEAEHQPQEGFSFRREQFTYLALFGVMTCIAGVALLVAALGIINTMLMSVLERTREIGVLKAVGARQGHMQAIFLVEGARIGLTGGILGLSVARAIAVPGDAWVVSLVPGRLKLGVHESLFVGPAWLVLGAPLFAALVTILAAVYPGRSYLESAPAWQERNQDRAVIRGKHERASSCLPRRRESRGGTT
jgi:putative ABC transport system permease protein